MKNRFESISLSRALLAPIYLKFVIFLLRAFIISKEVANRNIIIQMAAINVCFDCMVITRSRLEVPRQLEFSKWSIEWKTFRPNQLFWVRIGRGSGGLKKEGREGWTATPELWNSGGKPKVINSNSYSYPLVSVLCGCECGGCMTLCRSTTPRSTTSMATSKPMNCTIHLPGRSTRARMLTSDQDPRP